MAWHSSAKWVGDTMKVFLHVTVSVSVCRYLFPFIRLSTFGSQRPIRFCCFFRRTFAKYFIYISFSSIAFTRSPFSFSFNFPTHNQLLYGCTRKKQLDDSMHGSHLSLSLSLCTKSAYTNIKQKDVEHIHFKVFNDRHIFELIFAIS